MTWTETRHPGSDTLAATVAAELADIVRDALAQRGQASLALAGGSTPLPIYRRLAGARLDWPKVLLVPTDERWVDAGHTAHNGRALRAAFAGCAGVRWPDPTQDCRSPACCTTRPCTSKSTGARTAPAPDHCQRHRAHPYAQPRTACRLSGPD